jgi:hypothetical protein
MYGDKFFQHDVTQALVAAQAEFRDFKFPENECLDVRLQVIPSEAMDWHLRTGSSDYDQDHRGAWGAASIDADMSVEALSRVAAELISQVDEMLAGE